MESTQTLLRQAMLDSLQKLTEAIHVAGIDSPTLPAVNMASKPLTIVEGTTAFVHEEDNPYREAIITANTILAPTGLSEGQGGRVIIIFQTPGYYQVQLAGVVCGSFPQLDANSKPVTGPYQAYQLDYLRNSRTLTWYPTYLGQLKLQPPTNYTITDLGAGGFQHNWTAPDSGETTFRINVRDVTTSTTSGFTTIYLPSETNENKLAEQWSHDNNLSFSNGNYFDFVASRKYEFQLKSVDNGPLNLPDSTTVSLTITKK